MYIWNTKVEITLGYIWDTLQLGPNGGLLCFDFESSDFNVKSWITVFIIWTTLFLGNSIGICFGFGARNFDLS
jgi:hypothetical protein